MNRYGALALAAVLFLFAGGRRAIADGSWLDAPLQNWNTPGATAPQAPPVDPGLNADCAGTARPAETHEDAAVSDAGWALVGTYQGAYGMKVVLGTSSWDGMCRPFRYPAFVFVNGTFAGTLSPEPMAARADGSLIRSSISRDSLSADFSRYADTDPLCCPSGTSYVNYSVQTVNGYPVVVPSNASTVCNG